MLTAEVDRAISGTASDHIAILTDIIKHGRTEIVIAVAALKLASIGTSASVSAIIDLLEHSSKKTKKREALIGAFVLCSPLRYAWRDRLEQALANDPDGLEESRRTYRDIKKLNKRLLALGSPFEEIKELLRNT